MMGADGSRRIVLCDESGAACGRCTVLEAHTGAGRLHRAFSVFVFNQDGCELIIQQRNPAKLLFGGLWANTCCSHPRPEDGDDIVTAGKRRLQEECGFSVDLQVAGRFVYRADDPNGAGAEHEHDTVLVGLARTTTALSPDPAEVAAWRWIGISELQRELAEHPELYAPWLPPALGIALAHLPEILRS